MKTTTPQKRSSGKTPKAQLYTNLARHGIVRVVIEYDGCGDSGCIGTVTLFGIDDRVIKMPKQQVKYTSVSRIYNKKTERVEPLRQSHTGTLDDAIKSWCYDLLEVHFPGWEINEGSDGTIELNVPMKTGSWKHTTNFIDTSTDVLEV